MRESTRTISMSPLGRGSYEYRAYFVTSVPGKGWTVTVGPEWCAPRSAAKAERLLAMKKTRDAAAAFIDRRIYNGLKRARAEYRDDLAAVRAGTMRRGDVRYALYPQTPSSA